ncbi:MAG: class II fructose-bisphosphate aldolase, partial [Erysipelotrichaceae bacterium]
MLTTTKEMLLKAKEEGYAIPSPDFFDSNSVRDYVRVAEERNQPIILAFAQAHAEMLNLEEAAMLGKFYAEKASVPVALHLDHGVTLDFIKQAIDLGFSSVMIDASMKSFEENVSIT